MIIQILFKAISVNKKLYLKRKHSLSLWHIFLQKILFMVVFLRNTLAFFSLTEIKDPETKVLNREHSSVMSISTTLAALLPSAAESNKEL